MTLNKDSSVGRLKLHIQIWFAEARENKMKSFFCSRKLKILLLILSIITDELFASHQALLRGILKNNYSVVWPFWEFGVSKKSICKVANNLISTNDLQLLQLGGFLG